MKYSFIATEGIQDVAFISKILKNLGFAREKFQRIIEHPSGEDCVVKPEERFILDEFWNALIPNRFPADKTGDFTGGIPLPWFWHNEHIGVAVRGLGGLNVFVERLRLNLLQISPTDLFSIGFVLDADTKVQPLER